MTSQKRKETEAKIFKSTPRPQSSSHTQALLRGTDRATPGPCCHGECRCIAPMWTGEGFRNTSATMANSWVE